MEDINAAENVKITLTTQDGEKVEVDKDIAVKSKLVQGIVDESPDEEIPLPSVKKATLDKILEFMTYEHQNQPPAEIEKPVQSPLSEQVGEWYSNYSNMQLEELIEVILAANFMDVKSLLELCCAQLAYNIKGMSIK